MNDVTKSINLPGGNHIVLLDRLAKESIYGAVECARNIFMLDSTEQPTWQIISDFDKDGGSFTNILLEDGVLKGYRWDGGVYKIDLATGKAIPATLAK